MTNGSSSEELLYDLEKSRLWYTFCITIGGLVVALVVAISVLLISAYFSMEISAEGIAAIVGLFTSVLGTIVGAFLGLQIGLDGKAKVEATRLQAMTVAIEAIEKLRNTDPAAASQLRQRLG